MKRQKVRVIVLIALVVGAMAVPAVFADDDGYAEVAELLSTLVNRIELTIFMTPGFDTRSLGMASEAEARERQAQGVINLIEGVDGDNFAELEPDDEYDYYSPLGYVPHHLEGMIGGLERLERLTPTQYLSMGSVSGYGSQPAATKVEYWQAQDYVEAYVHMALEEAILARDGADDPDLFLYHMHTCRAFLLVARGDPDDKYLQKGLRLIAGFFPERRNWVAEGESIQAAINRVPAGSTILIEPGIYREDLVFPYDVNLVGFSDLGGTVIMARKAPVIEAHATRDRIRVSIFGITIEGGGTATGVALFGAIDLALQDVRFNNFTNAAIYADGSSRVQCQGVSFERCNTAVILADSAVFEGGRLEIAGCTSDQAAILLADSSSLSLQDSVITDSVGDGILYEPTASIELNDVELLRNGGYGVRMKDAVCETDPDAPKMDYFTIQETYHVSGEANTSPDSDEEDGNALGGFCPEILEILEYAPSSY